MRSTARRAMTLLETLLAAVLAGVLLVVCLGVFGALDRAEARYAARHAQTGELARLHRVASRAMGTLVVATPQQIPLATTTAEGVVEEPEGGPGVRFDLAIDSEASARLVRAGVMSYDGSPQRLELVLRRSPVGQLRPDGIATGAVDPEILAPRRRAGGASRGEGDDARINASGSSSARDTRARRRDPVGTSRRGTLNADERDAFVDPDEAERLAEAAENGELTVAEARVAAVRGAFELWPDGIAPPDAPPDVLLAFAPPGFWSNDGRARVPAGGARAGEPGATLWWRPLPPGELPSGFDLAAFELPPPVPLASGLTRAEWRVFHRRAFRTTHTGALLQDVPAYVQLEVRSLGGLYASWLFEIGWGVGREVELTEVPLLEDEDDQGPSEQERVRDRLRNRDVMPGGGRRSEDVRRRDGTPREAPR